MSDYIPSQIQEDIIARLPVKSLLRLRSVSKHWNSLIGNSHFISQYNPGHHTNLQHLLVWYHYDNPTKHEQKYVSVADDATYPQQNVPLTLPLSVKMLQDVSIIGCCNGLICFYGDHEMGCTGQISGTGRAVLWNPSIRKTVSVFVPNVAVKIHTVLGFGVCRETNDFKLVKITYIRDPKMVPYQAEFFTLSTGVWRSLQSNLPRKSIRFGLFNEALDGFVYWLATDGGFPYNYWPEEGHYHNLIISFDMTSGKIREIHLPDNLAHTDRAFLFITKLMKSLVVIEYGYPKAHDEVSYVWMMVDSSAKSFTKLYTINSMVGSRHYVWCFRNTGEHILEVIVDGDDVKLAVYEPCSKLITNLEIKLEGVSFSVYRFVESLHLLSYKGEQYVSKPRGKNRCILRKKGIEYC